jgi:protein SCO1/2
MSKTSRILLSVTLCLAAIYSIWYYLAPRFTYTAPQTVVATTVQSTQPIHKFALTDTNGKLFSEKSLRGHWTLVFFGYVGCPDICPATLNLVREAWQKFPADQPPARFVFAEISGNPVDKATLRQFLHHYDANFLGVSGNPAAMHQFSDQLGIYAQPQGNRIDHTAALLLINPQGRLSAVFSPPFTADDIAADLRLLTKK